MQYNAGYVVCSPPPNLLSSKQVVVEGATTNTPVFSTLCSLNVPANAGEFYLINVAMNVNTDTNIALITTRLFSQNVQIREGFWSLHNSVVHWGFVCFSERVQVINAVNTVRLDWAVDLGVATAKFASITTMVTRV